MKLPQLAIKGFSLDNCIFQGGMGVGVSRWRLSREVAKEGGMGIVSSAGLRTIISSDGKVVDTYTAVRMELDRAKNFVGGGTIGINVMCALVIDYEDTIRAAIDSGVSAIISGAGLPLGLPGIQSPGHTALIPIVSSARALEIIIKRWERLHYRPDAVVLEGPMAGGHLGFKLGEVYDPTFALEKLLPEVLEVSHKHGDFPVIVAGGIYTHGDILRFLAMGASGVQMGTRFMVTHESSATLAYKQAVIAAEKDDIAVVPHGKFPGSPCMLPFRVLKTSPVFKLDRIPKCEWGYVMQKGPDGRFTECQAAPKCPRCKEFLCICTGLLASAGYAPPEYSLYTVGSNAHRVDRTLSVSELMTELRGG